MSLLALATRIDLSRCLLSSMSSAVRADSSAALQSFSERLLVAAPPLLYQQRNVEEQCPGQLSRAPTMSEARH